MKIHILDYGLGNIKSLSNALRAACADVEVVVITSFEGHNIQKLIIPGVGSFSKAMELIREKGLEDKIHKYAESGKLLLGICLGMQILASSGDEGGFNKGLGLIKGRIVSFDPETSPLIPNVGYSELSFPKKDHPLFKDLKSNPPTYFTHSFYFAEANPEEIICTSMNGREFIAGVGNENVFGLQFHPEISQDQGLKILENFCKL